MKFGVRNIDEVTVIPVIESTGEHNESGFCWNTAHECHEDKWSVNDLQDAIDEGEITTEDADNIFRGRTV